MINKIGYLGKNNEHLMSLVSAFDQTGVEIIPIEMSPNYSSNVFIREQIVKISAKFFGSNNSEFVQVANTIISDNNLSVILAYWGTNVIPDIIAIKKCNPNLKIILNVMCHPMGLTPLSVISQNKYMKYARKFIDGYLFSNELMRDYFRSKIFYSDVPHLVVPPLLSRKFFPKNFQQPCSNQPNLLFLGRPDWWNGQPTDNLSSQLTEAIQAGIHVYHADDSTSADPGELRHSFHYMTFTELKDFATQFDASLIVYNLDSVTNTDRFTNTVPDRLIASVAFGIPIVIPRSGYTAIKSFLHEYEAVIEFDNYDELFFIMSNRPYMDELRQIARNNSIKYSLEGYLPQLLTFFSNL